MCAVPPGLVPLPQRNPALKRWAKLFRPGGACSLFPPSIDVPRQLCRWCRLGWLPSNKRPVEEEVINGRDPRSAAKQYYCPDDLEACRPSIRRRHSPQHAEPHGQLGQKQHRNHNKHNGEQIPPAMPLPIGRFEDEIFSAYRHDQPDGEYTNRYPGADLEHISGTL